MKKIGLLMGSDSDLPVMQKALDIFKEFGVPYEAVLASAHRTPAAVKEFAETAEERGNRVPHCRCGNGGSFSRCCRVLYDAARHRSSS